MTARPSLQYHGMKNIIGDKCLPSYYDVWSANFKRQEIELAWHLQVLMACVFLLLIKCLGSKPKYSTYPAAEFGFRSQSDKPLELKVVVFHWQVLPVHPHDHEDLGPPRRLRFPAPVVQLFVGVLQIQV